HTLLALRTDLPADTIRLTDEDASATFTLGAGQAVAFSLIYSDTAPAPLPLMGEAALDRLKYTQAYWRRWVSRATYGGRYSKEVKRSALALKLLFFSPSGAIVA